MSNSHLDDKGRVARTNSGHPRCNYCFGASHARVSCELRKRDLNNNVDLIAHPLKGSQMFQPGFRKSSPNSQHTNDQTPHNTSSNSQAPMPLTVTDPKNVEWLRRIDLDQVISTFRQMQQFNSRNQENSEQTPKISSSLLSLPPSEYAGRPNPQQHGSTKSTQIGKLRTHFY